MTRALQGSSPENHGETHEVVRDISDAVNATVSVIRSDLERARTVVRDASARLSTSFQRLHAASVEHREVLVTVTQSLHDRANGGRSFAASSEALLRQFVDEIIRVSRDSMLIIDQIGELNGRIDGIATSADAIDGLARETRFIAFNARIETHRAGNAGRTFKVVADEVKRLANASSTLSNQIRQGVSECHERLSSLRTTATGLASHDMSSAIDSHKGLSEAINRLDSVNTHLEQMLNDLERAVSEAVIALQFEDMVTQLINKTIQRVEDMASCTTRAMRVLEQGQNGDRTRPLMDVLHDLRQLTDRVAVQQESMAHGSVDLF